MNGSIPFAGTPAPFHGRIGIADDPPRMIELTSSEETRPPIDHLPPFGPDGKQQCLTDPPTKGPYIQLTLLTSGHVHSIVPSLSTYEEKYPGRSTHPAVIFGGEATRPQFLLPTQ